MALLLFAQTMFGNLIVIRILRRFGNRSLISTTSLTKIGTAFAFVISFGVIFVFPLTRILPIFLIFTSASAYVLLKVREKQRIVNLAERFPHFLDRWLLNLRTGCATNLARERALEACDPQFRALIRPLLDPARAQAPSPSHLFLTVNTVRELHAVQLESHNTVPRLQNLRRSLARESEFRRKSGQALRQSSIQSLALILMHFALALFTTVRCGLHECADLLGWSTLLTATGLLLLRLLARRIRWTI